MTGMYFNRPGSVKSLCNIMAFLFTFLLSPHLLHAQTRIYSGVVQDEAGAPLGGVSITVKESKVGTSSAANGSFSINARPASTLSFSFVGYESKEVFVEKENSINVRLSQSANNLSNVVVIGYGTQKKREQTAAISSVSGKDIV